jgi:HAMP domain-containing protein
MIWMAVLLGAAAALALALMARLESQRIEQQWTEAGRVVAETTEDSLEVGMLNNSPDDIRRSVRNIEEGELVDSVTVYRRTGTPWVTSNPELELSSAAHAALLTSMDTEETLTSLGNETLSVFVPVLKQPECVGCHAEASSVLGAVEVRLDERPFRAELTKSARTSLAFAAIPLLLGIVISVWAVRRDVLRPLAEVGEAAEKLGEGDLTVRLPKLQGWEFAEVSTTFNDMATRLERQQTDLRETADELRSELAGMEEIRSLLTSGRPGRGARSTATTSAWRSSPRASRSGARTQVARGHLGRGPARRRSGSTVAEQGRMSSEATSPRSLERPITGPSSPREGERAGPGRARRRLGASEAPGPVRAGPARVARRTRRRGRAQRRAPRRAAAEGAGPAGAAAQDAHGPGG